MQQRRRHRARRHGRQERRQGRKGGTVQVLQNSAFSYLDPARDFDGGVNAFYRLVYRTLVTKAANDASDPNAMVPDLAESLGKASPDGKTWTYKLKQGVRFDTGADEALAPQGQQHRRFVVCGIGHHLGLDVHDCGRSEYEQYHGALLEPGMVLTVEPGLYFHAHDETIPPELRGIGIRLEDDPLVTATGNEVMSGDLPIGAPSLERWTLAR